MKFDFKYKLVLWKSWFDKGYGLTNYLKYPLAYFALYEITNLSNFKLTLIAVLFYVVFAWFLGWAWFHWNWIRAEAEVANRYNYFQQEVRKALKTRRFK